MSLTAIIDQKLKDIIKPLYDLPNLKFIVYSDCVRCKVCGRLMYKECTDKMYIPQIDKEEYIDTVVETISNEGIFTIIELTKGEVTEIDGCDNCTADYNEPREEGPYGGAFRDWNDYYYWKNGSLIL